MEIFQERKKKKCNSDLDSANAGGNFLISPQTKVLNAPLEENSITTANCYIPVDQVPVSEVVSLQDQMVCRYMDLVEDQWYHHHYHDQARQVMS